jgi:hypothetical protein
MEHAAVESPLTDEQLKELGRLVVDCGFAEFILGMHVSMLLEIPFQSRDIAIHALPFRRKLDILQSRVDEIPKAETRTLVAEACKIIGPAIGERNLLLHGLWGVDKDGPDAKAVVAATTKKQGQRYAADITKCADAMAVASMKLKHAAMIDGGGEENKVAERLLIKP